MNTIVNRNNIYIAFAKFTPKICFMDTNPAIIGAFHMAQLYLVDLFGIKGVSSFSSVSLSISLSLTVLLLLSIPVVASMEFIDMSGSADLSKEPDID